MRSPTKRCLFKVTFITFGKYQLKIIQQSFSICTRGNSFLRTSVKNAEKLASTNIGNEEKFRLLYFCLHIYWLLEA